jgi:hypothetical protein
MSNFISGPTCMGDASVNSSIGAHQKRSKIYCIEVIDNVREIKEDSPQAHKKMLELLYQLADITAGVDWYTYGIPKPDGNRNF